MLMKKEKYMKILLKNYDFIIYLDADLSNQTQLI